MRRYRKRATADATPTSAEPGVAAPIADSSAPPSTALPDTSSLPPENGTTTVALAGVVPPKRPNGKNHQKGSFGPGIKARVSQILSLRALGHKDKEIAEKLGVNLQTVHQYMWLAGKRGYLNQSHPDTRLMYEIPDKIVRNVSQFLDSPDSKTRMEMTLEAARGTGVFKQHQAARQDGAVAMSAISVQVVMPQGIEQNVVEGSIGGVEGVYTEDDPST